jgi:peptide-methionine (S)-S-oxide reductase
MSDEKSETTSTSETPTKKATFAAGCFWGPESTFRRVHGVLDVAVGYEGGHVAEPTYEQVCAKTTGHAEVVEIDYDPSRVSYEELLEVFWKCHDPTTLDRQGPDVGSQYRSAVFTHDGEQEAAARLSKEKREASGVHRSPIVTEITPATTFWRAEEYHQQYFERRGIQH